jgi:hypothetical protein
LTCSFIDGNGGSGSNGLIQEQLGATVSPNATHTSAPQQWAPKKTQGKDLRFGALTERERGEIQRLNSKLDAMGILLNTKEKQIRRSKRRRKLRIYLPDTNKPRQ